MIYIANWKCNANHCTIQSFMQQFPLIIEPKLNHNSELIVCPNSAHYHLISPIQDKINIGAQDMSHHRSRNLTGGITPEILQDYGVGHLIIGHYERRSIFNEGNAILNAKIKIAQSLKLKIIYCIGETAASRNAGNYLETLTEQINLIDDFANISIAYEPVWSIGTDQPANNQQILEAITHIKKLIPKHVRVFYGGSVTPKNAENLKKITGLDGFLIGGASIKAKALADIMAA